MPADVPTLRSKRLELVSLGVPFLRALAANDTAAAARELGAAIPADLPQQLSNFVRYRLRQLDEDPSIVHWLARAMVLTDDNGTRRAIGTIGFHGAPDEQGRLEIGYRVEPEYRRRGYTSEAVRAMLDWAATEHGIHRFIASVRPDNAASLGLVAGFGFAQTGTQMDDIDGLELVLEATWPRPDSAGGVA